MTLHQCYC